MSSLQDRGDELLGILRQNPDKINRKLLVSLKLDAKLFSEDTSQQHLFRAICLAAYASKQVDETFLEAYGSRNKLTVEQTDDLKFALDRCREYAKPWSGLEDTVMLFTQEVRHHRLKKLLLQVNDDLENERASVDDLLVRLREKSMSIAEDAGDTGIQSVRDITQQFIEEYQKADDENGCVYGMQQIDKVIKSMQPGELHTLAGASGQGKSQVLTNVVYQNLLRHKNVVWASLEMNRTQCLYRLISLHSTHPKFGYNLPVLDIKNKTLDPTQEGQFYEVLQDLFENPEYGQLFFTDTATTADEIFTQAEDINRYVHIDMVALDYISLLDGQGKDDQEKASRNFKKVKNYALTFAKGQKVVAFTVHQINEQSREKAEEEGGYTFNFLAGTSEAKKSSDMVCWILRTKAHEDSHEVLVGVHKTRSSGDISNFSMFEQFEFSKISDIDAELE